MTFTCCFGGCPYIAEDDRIPLIPISQNHYIVTRTKRKFKIERDGLFSRLYFPEDLENNNKYSFIQ